jgi:hypothetical protein
VDGAKRQTGGDVRNFPTLSGWRRPVPTHKGEGDEDEERPMAGLKDKRGFNDKDRLDLSERKAVEYWMKRWGVTKDQLTAAHRKVGRLTKDIAAELGKKR